MKVINGRNVNDNYVNGIDFLMKHGVESDSRAGKVIVSPWPVMSVYNQPRERVLFDEQRDANPFFHFMEALWMLAGRRDVEFLTKYVARMKDFSDDGKVFNGAYGYRWRHWFNYGNQLQDIIEELKINLQSRRCVLAMWDGHHDLGLDSKDLPCNTHCYFRVRDGVLDMTICCRSNDIIWGAYGANAVHFSMLQEYMAAGIGVSTGIMYQLSNNYHAYTNVVEKVFDPSPLAGLYKGEFPQPYNLYDVEPTPMISGDFHIWNRDLKMFLEYGNVVGLTDRFFRRVAGPISLAHQAYRENDGHQKYEVPLEILEQCVATDWRMACDDWIGRRYEKFLNRVEPRYVKGE